MKSFPFKLWVIIFFWSAAVLTSVVLSIMPPSHEASINNNVEDYNPPAEELRFAANDADLQLSLNLLRHSLALQNDNIVISPASFYITLALLANGATGKSLQELKNVLNLPQNINLAEVNQNLESYLHNTSPKVEINSSIWADNLTSEYKKAIKHITDVKSLPWYTSKINKWIATATKKKITNIIPNKRTSSEEIYIVNTVYFKDKWQAQFKEENTITADHFSSLNTLNSDSVNMMHQINENTLYYEDEKMQAICLPYLTGDYLQIFLPKKNIDFNDFVSNLQTADLNVEYTSHTVSIYLPRFEIDLTLDGGKLKEMLNLMGAADIFKRFNQDFLRLSKSEKFIAAIAHQSIIKVDEEGTEAAAATYVDIELGIEDIEEPILFEANRPFIFMLNKGLFIGAYIKGEMQ